MKNTKDYILGKNELDNKLKVILKNKKLTNEEKCNQLIEEYNKYFSNKFISDVHYITSTLYIGEYMNNNIVNEQSYNKYFRYEFENLLYYHIATSTITINKLCDNGLDKNKILESNRSYINDAANLYNSYFAYGLDGRKYYSNKIYRKEMLNGMVDFFEKHYNDVLNNYKEKEQTFLKI